MGTYDQQTRSLEFPLTFTSTRRHCKAWNTCKMKCYIILTVIVALTVSHAEEVEIVETREKCHHTPTGPVCDKEVLKREICTNGVCKKVSADFEVVEMREKCRPTPSGPICDKEVLKREMCKEGPGPLGPRCKKVEEDVHEIVETREKCRHTPTGPLCDKEVPKREICTNGPGSVGPGSTGPGSTGPGSVGVCKKVSEDFEVVEAREKCRGTPAGAICDKEILKREKCRGTPAGAICDKEVLKREKCRGTPAGAICD